MSITYSIKFWSDDGINAIAEHVVQLCGFQVDPHHGGRSPIEETITLLGDCVAIDVREASALDREICKSDLAIDINRNLLVFPGAEFSTDSEAAVQLVSIICELIVGGRGDLVALFSGEKVLLLHRGDETLVSDSAGFWNERTEKALLVPYKRASLPSI